MDGPVLSKALPPTRNTEQATHLPQSEAKGEPAMSHRMDRLEGHVKQGHCGCCTCHHTHVGRRETRGLSSSHSTRLTNSSKDRNTNDQTGGRNVFHRAIQLNAGMGNNPPQQATLGQVLGTASVG